MANEVENLDRGEYHDSKPIDYCSSLSRQRCYIRHVKSWKLLCLEIFGMQTARYSSGLEHVELKLRTWKVFRGGESGPGVS
jgi:hypothetical protein